MGVGTDTPNQNAVLELVSPTNDQGFLVPRYTTSERTATSFTSKLATIDNGMMVFDSDEGQFYFWFDGAWQMVTNVSSGGDMAASTYDIDLDGIVDNAAFVNNLTVETAVPSSAVFTDNQSAVDVAVTPSGNLTSTEVQSALVELQTEIDSDSGGDMLRSVYDTNSDNVIDTVTNAGFINGLTVETAVPASAVFTDDQEAVDVAVTPSGNLNSIEVQSALEELQTDIDASVPSPWTNTAGDLSYNLGKVGVNTTNLLSDFQVGNRIHFYKFVNTAFEIDGDIIGHNTYRLEDNANGDDILNAEKARTAGIFFNDGDIQFLHGDTTEVGESAISVGGLSSSLTLGNSGDAEFRGAVEIGTLSDSTNLSSGTLSYGSGGFYGFNGSEWLNLGGFSFPSQSFIDESGSVPFVIENSGSAGIARFQVNNTSTFGNAVDIINNSEETTSGGLILNHDGLGPGSEILLNNANNAQNAIYSRTVGTGYAGRFEIDNASNNNVAVLGRVDNGTGKAIEGYMAGEGQAARFTVANSSNGSIAMSVRSDGTNSAAFFENTNSGASTATVQISNNGTGSGLTIQNPGGTTSFGDVSFINGDLGIGQFNPSAKLDVVGDTELNGDVTTTGDISASGGLTTGGAVYSGVQSVGNSDVTIKETEHIINLAGTVFNSVAPYVITLPDSNASSSGRELILIITGGAHYSVGLQNGNEFIKEGLVATLNQSMSRVVFGHFAVMHLKSIGNYWVIVSYTLNGAA